MNVATEQPTVKQLIATMDDAWAPFHDAVRALPAQLLEQRLGENGWTRKQMLAHVAAWHDITVERLSGFHETGEPAPFLEDEDAVNARAARGAEGRTTGEVLLTLDESFRRLRREVARLSNEDAVAFDAWAARMIAGNSFGHYGEHLSDLIVRR
ncbi:MAG TPA: DinB family protein [Candidatus Limnocylindrales bacterium]|nr:DinB family protein [Candidatus Limnocylindrales bacterium]